MTDMPPQTGEIIRSRKQRSLDELVTMASDARRRGGRIVWTNGCFEILHAGHIEFLIKAAKLGDMLIVGVNSDDSVRTLKGEGHPLTSEQERLLVLSAVACVDYLTVFTERDCAGILRALQPDVYAKGLLHLRGGLNEDERRVVEEQGGCIALIAGDPAVSTETIMRRVRGDAR